MNAPSQRDWLAGRCIIVQPAIPTYRVPLFDRLAAKLPRLLSVYGSDLDLGVLSEPSTARPWQRSLGPMQKLAPGLFWQRGILGIDLKQDDTVVVSGEPRRLSNLALLLRARSVGARTIWWGQFWSATSQPGRATMRRALMRFADTLLFYTDQEVSEYRSSAGRGAKARVFALNNGIDTTEIRRLRRPYLASQRGRRLLFIGRLTAKTGLDLLLDALATPPCADVFLSIIGSGETEGLLKERARKLHVENRVAWIPGTTDERAIASVVNDCALFVYPGAVGLSLVHAMAYGLPAIVHDERLRHMPEIAAMRDGANGLLFRQGDAASLAATIHAALADEGRLGRMSAAAIQTTTESFNTDDMARRFEEAIVATAGARPY